MYDFASRDIVLLEICTFI